MNLQITDKIDGSLHQRIHDLYEISFPDNEKKPWSLIRELHRQKRMEINAVLANGQFAGLIIAIPDDDQLLIDYFAIDPELRSRGIGAAALDAYKQIKKDYNLVLEVEYALNLPEESIEYRRMKFYEKLGFQRQDYKISLFGVPMSILTYTKPVSFDRYVSILCNTIVPEVRQYITLLEEL